MGILALYDKMYVCFALTLRNKNICNLQIRPGAYVGTPAALANFFAY